MKAEYGGLSSMQEGAYVKKKMSVAVQFATVKYRSVTYCWTKKLNRSDYGVDKNWVLVFCSLLRFEISRQRLRFLAC
jgi:anaerobic selenocysteine-containing dehydrogenase